MAKKKPSKTKISWNDEASLHVNKLCKNKKCGILVLSQAGDVIFKAGIAEKIDAISVGALSSAMQEARMQLDRITGVKTKLTIFGDAKNGYWIEPLGSWLVVGIKLAPSAALKAFYKHLKKKSAGAGQTSEALSDLTSAGVDAALRNQ